MNSPRRRADASAVNALLDEAGAHYAAGRLDEAARQYLQVEAQNPKDIRARYSLAVIDIREGRFDAARIRLSAVARAHPDHFAAWHNLGVALQALGRWRQAAAAYRKARALRPDSAESAFSLAIALTADGQIEDAVGLYRALASDPATRARALSRLALLRPAAITDDELSSMRREAESETDESMSLHFAVAGVLNARGEFDEAFADLEAGAALKRATLDAGDFAERPNIVEQEHARSARQVVRAFGPAFVARHANDGDPAPTPIFIVGFPRCGSTLVEQILASHPTVQGLGEAGALSAAVNEQYPLATGGNPDPDYFRRLATGYLSSLKALGWKTSLRPVDKTLENYLHVGLIALMFPRAVILHCLRDPVDTCLACYRQLFASGNETLYDLGQIGREYVRYRAVMDHWNAMLPGRLVEVRYEALIETPEKTIRWLVTEACGLGWSPQCLKFHETRRAVATASADEVRRPIYSSSMQRWRRYERHLGPLFAALGPYAPARDRGSGHDPLDR